jgi:hypothetical protein
MSLRVGSDGARKRARATRPNQRLTRLWHASTARSVTND